MTRGTMRLLLLAPADAPGSVFFEAGLAPRASFAPSFPRRDSDGSVFIDRAQFAHQNGELTNVDLFRGWAAVLAHFFKGEVD